MMNEVTINGVIYQEREQPKRKMSKLLLMAQMFGGFNDTYYRQLPPNTDIVKEYELIQLKQSRLSRWERQAVVNIFERKYKIKCPVHPYQKEY